MMRSTITRATVLGVASMLALGASTHPPFAQAQTVPISLDDGADTAAAYCSNLADEANDARFARKLARLKEAEAKIDDRLLALERKRAEYEEWLKRREDFLAMAHESLVAIYSGMRPDAASEQLAAMGEITAAAVIARIEPRTASAILNEMETTKAARLASIMAGMSRTEENQG